jgi:hypothetical protein
MRIAHQRNDMTDGRINELALLNLGYDGHIRTLEFARAIEREVLATAGEPAAWQYQHEETGRILFVDPWQKENGWEEANDRFVLVGPVYSHYDKR